MKIGSIVECIRVFEPRWYSPNIPLLETPYTIGGFIKNSLGDIGIYLEEIKNPIVHFDNGFSEPAFSIECFRELQLPDDIEEVIKQEVRP